MICRAMNECQPLITTENRNWQLVIYKSVLPSPLVQNRWAFEKREASYTNDAYLREFLKKTQKHGHPSKVFSR
jgi:hypothetical protein